MNTFLSRFDDFRAIWRVAGMEKRLSMLAAMTRRAAKLAEEKEASGERDFASFVVKLACDFLRFESSKEFPAESGRLLGVLLKNFPETAMESLSRTPETSSFLPPDKDERTGPSLEGVLRHLRKNVDNANACSKYLAELVSSGRSDRDTKRMMMQFALVDCCVGDKNSDFIVENFFDLNESPDEDLVSLVLRQYEEHLDGRTPAFIARNEKVPAPIRKMAADALCGMKTETFLRGAGYIVAGDSCCLKDDATRDQKLLVFDRLLGILNDASSKTRSFWTGRYDTNEHNFAFEIVEKGLGHGAKNLDASMLKHIWGNLGDEEKKRLTTKRHDVVWNILACAPELLSKDAIASAVKDILKSRSKDEFVWKTLGGERVVAGGIQFLAVCSALCGEGKTPFSPQNDTTAEKMLEVVLSQLEKSRDEETLAIVQKFFVDCVEKRTGKKDTWPKHVVDRMSDAIAAAMAEYHAKSEFESSADSSIPAL